MTEPTTPGWYTYSNGTDVMIFHLRELDEFFGGGMQWSVHFTNGDSNDCHWEYIEQALGVWDLVPLVPLNNPPPPFGVVIDSYHTVALTNLDGIDE